MKVTLITVAAQHVVDLLLSKSSGSSRVSKTGISGQEATESSIGCVTKRAPCVDEDETFGCSGDTVHPFVTDRLGGILVCRISKNTGQDDVDTHMFVVPIEKFLNQGCVTIGIVKSNSIGLVSLLVSGQGHGSSGESELIVVVVWTAKTNQSIVTIMSHLGIHYYFILVESSSLWHRVGVFSAVSVGKSVQFASHCEALSRVCGVRSPNGDGCQSERCGVVSGQIRTTCSIANKVWWTVLCLVFRATPANKI